jgi:hypothetical protein
MRAGTGTEPGAILALVFSAAAFLALGIAWCRDGVRHYESPTWTPSRFARIVPSSATGGERWLVAVNLRCPHCQAHLRALARRIASRARPPALGAILVDQPARPMRLDLGAALPAGVWWDSAQVWREAWGRRAYGETFRFDARGRLLSATPAGTLPDSNGSRM